MLAAIAKYTLKSRILRENHTRQKKFLPWDKIERIAIILDKNNNLNKSAIDTFIDGTQKYVEIFYIETGSKQHSYADWQCFSKKEASLLNLPNKTIESELKTKRFDAVINTCPENNLFALSICATLPAYLKCGENNKFDLPDLVIKKTEPFDLIAYLHETVKYLKMIRI